MIDFSKCDALLLQFEFDWNSIQGKAKRHAAKEVHDAAVPKLSKAVEEANIDELANIVASLKKLGVEIFSLHVGQIEMSSAFDQEVKQRWACYTSIGHEFGKIQWIQVWHDKHQ